jgi:hypothetical protein
VPPALGRLSRWTVQLFFMTEFFAVPIEQIDIHT